MLQSCRSPDGWAEVRVTPPFSSLAGLRLSILHDMEILHDIPPDPIFPFFHRVSKKQFSLLNMARLKNTLQ
jgi:hypothetical protein